jgi:hypothetical protein
MGQLLPLAISIAVLWGMASFFAGQLPIPVGYDRGKVKFLKWCGSGMHAHIVYRHSSDIGHTDRAGYQTIHPDDLSDS